MKKSGRIALLILLLCMCTGCSKYSELYSENTIIIKNSGKLIEVAVEDYSDTRVKADDLTAYIEGQIEKYNNENGKGLVKEKELLTEDMKKATLVLQYKSIDDYNEFNSLSCVLSNYTELDEEKLTGNFTDAEGNTVKPDKFEDVEKAKVLIISEPTNIVVGKNILYYNNQITIKDGVITSSGKKDAIIIYK